MICAVCGANDWENVDAYRVKKVDMCMCKSCGYVSYPNGKSEEEMKEFYKKEYRQAPQSASLYTGERKLHYHNFFLAPILEEWRKAGITKPVIGEIGSAFGMFLNWIRERFPDADISGTELTTSMRRVAKMEYGINLTEEFDYTKKYDLIVSYHVLEHQLEPDKKLKEYADCLAPGGLLYLSAPVWFRDADNSAAGSFDLEEYWHPNHVNCWGDDHLDWIVAKAGLEPIMKNTVVYGNTYILRKVNKKFDKPTFNPEACLDYIKRAYECWLAIQKNETAVAIERLPNCTTAWIHHYEFNRATFDKNKEGLEQFFKDAEAACPDSANMLITIADIKLRYERYDDAIKDFGRALGKKPNNPTVIMGLANAYRMKSTKEKDPKVKAELIKKSIDALTFVRHNSLEFKDRAISWLWHDYSTIE